jgi:hypothetical protein
MKKTILILITIIFIPYILYAEEFSRKSYSEDKKYFLEIDQINSDSKFVSLSLNLNSTSGGKKNLFIGWNVEISSLNKKNRKDYKVSQDYFYNFDNETKTLNIFKFSLEHFKRKFDVLELTIPIIRVTEWQDFCANNLEKKTDWAPLDCGPYGIGFQGSDTQAWASVVFNNNIDNKKEFGTWNSLKYFIHNYITSKIIITNSYGKMLRYGLSASWGGGICTAYFFSADGSWNSNNTIAYPLTLKARAPLRVNTEIKKFKFYNVYLNNN